MAISLYPGQMKALEQLANGKILAGDVGSGKSIVALAYYYTKIAGGSIQINGQGENLLRKDPVPLYIFTTAKKRDSKEWLVELGRFALDEHSPGGVVIDSWNNITKYTEVKDSFIIFDEQRLVGSGAWVKTFYKLAKHNRWILLSATPGDVWMDYCPVFVANGFYANKTEFTKAHVVYSNWGGFPKIDKYINTVVLEHLRRRLLVEIPFERRTKRHVRHINVGYDKERFERAWKERWHEEEQRPILDVAELFRVVRKIVNSDQTRTTALRELLTEHPRLIVFYNFNYELEILRALGQELSQSGVQTAEWNGHKHQAIPTTDSWLYFVQYTAGAEGWECITTDAMVFWSLNYSYKVWHQAMGRIDRFNTPFTDLYYYVFKSDSLIDKAIYKANRLKKTFNERGFMRKIEA